jgi:hypothetical protein
MRIAELRDKHLGQWLPGYLAHLARSLAAGRARRPRHLLFALCDHYEPLWHGAGEGQALARVRAWHESYPRLAAGFRDSTGRPPQHSFFFPVEQYRAAFFDRLDELVRAGLGEVEVHLHHDRSTPSETRSEILAGVEQLGARGHLGRGADGSPRYAFIHGNWALANAHRDGRDCGVDAELPLLFDTGCYADFTFPSAPDPAQSNRVNQIYWPVGDLARRRSYAHGERARVGRRHGDRILMITGPLALARRAGRARVRLEYGALTAHDPPTRERVATWVAQHIHVAGRPEWIFVKVYTHGAGEDQAAALLGAAGRELHRILGERYDDGERWQLHYVTAREMFNIALAAMDGHAGSPAAFRDYAIAPPPLRRTG